VNVLIVDDHAAMRAMIRSMLDDVTNNSSSPSRCHIRECISGEEAIGVCGSYAPDFITMDLRMSGMSGLTCVQQLRALHPATQIAVITQFDNDALRARAKQAGANIYITKDNLEPLGHYVQCLSAAWVKS
jgi:DNA-binding NarL/FixJ family response regulator